MMDWSCRDVGRVGCIVSCDGVMASEVGLTVPNSTVSDSSTVLSLSTLKGATAGEWASMNVSGVF